MTCALSGRAREPEDDGQQPDARPCSPAGRPDHTHRAGPQAARRSVVAAARDVTIAPQRSDQARRLFRSFTGGLSRDKSRTTEFEAAPDRDHGYRTGENAGTVRRHPWRNGAARCQRPAMNPIQRRCDNMTRPNLGRFRQRIQSVERNTGKDISSTVNRRD